jgi:hypothetical protein
MLYLIATALLSAVFFAKVMSNAKNVKAAS